MPDHLKVLFYPLVKMELYDRHESQVPAAPYIDNTYFRSKFEASAFVCVRKTCSIFDPVFRH